MTFPPSDDEIVFSIGLMFKPGSIIVFSNCIPLAEWLICNFVGNTIRWLILFIVEEAEITTSPSNKTFSFKYTSICADSVRFCIKIRFVSNPKQDTDST